MNLGGKVLINETINNNVNSAISIVNCNSNNHNNDCSAIHNVNVSHTVDGNTDVGNHYTCENQHTEFSNAIIVMIVICLQPKLYPQPVYLSDEFLTAWSNVQLEIEYLDKYDQEWNRDPFKSYLFERDA